MNESTTRSIPWSIAAALCVVALLGGVWLGAVAFVDRSEPAPLVAPIEVLDTKLEISGSVEYLRDEEVYILALYSMPPAPAGSTYQIWMEKDDVIISAGLWNPTTNRIAFAAYSGRYDTMFVTLEPTERGNSHPTTDRLVTIDLTGINAELEDE
ncbi:MAG: anti-sigma factor [Thermomicrobiales bacterium]|nr:anti-sigma factor [Thermomicrobiales bacterium]